MPRQSNQKLKILYLKSILENETDEQHPLTVSEIISRLNGYGVSAERKSIYSDIELLNSDATGLDIKLEKKHGYYLASREFELPEIKLLADLVQSSKFLTEKKSAALIKKLKTLCNVHQANQISGHIIAANRLKNQNEKIYYSIDAVQTAISGDRKIIFKYYMYNADKKAALKRNGEFYTVSPYALICDDENYYMAAFDSEAGIIKHYRVDRMTDVMCIDEVRDGAEAFKKSGVERYSSKYFSMFGGTDEYVKIRFENSLAAVVIDRFGKDVMMIRQDDGHFYINAEVVVSPQFYSWIFGLEGKAQIIAPESAVDGMRRHIDKVLKSMGET